MEERKEAYKKEYKRTVIRQSRIRLRVFAAIAGVFFLIGLLFPLRPKTSAAENRALAEFPKMTGASLMDGSFFTDLETWYADTYPLREPMISLHMKWQRLYGVKTSALYGAATGVADEIPDIGEAAPVVVSSEKDGENGTDNGSDQESIEAESIKPDSVNENEAADAGNDMDGAGENADGNAENGENGDGTAGDGPGGEDENGPDESSTAEENGDAAEEEHIPEEFGTVYVADGRGYSVYYFQQAGMQAYASMLSTVRQMLPDDVRIFSLPVPTAYGVYLSAKTQASLGGSDMAKAYTYLLGIEDPAIIQVPVLDALTAHRDEYIYFNTDHHWTALGAWYAYSEFAKAAGFTPNPLSAFEKVTYTDFLGSYYDSSNQAPELAANKDYVDAYIPMATNTMQFTGTDGTVYDWQVITDVSGFPEKSKYMCFVAGDQPFESIHNPNKTDGSSIAVVKESYANAFVPFLVDHYEDVYIFDHRYYKGNVAQFIRENDVDDLLFMNHLPAMTEYDTQSILSIFE